MKPIPTEKLQVENAPKAPSTVRASASTAGSHGAILLEWTAPEFIQHPKGRLWFLLATVVIFALVMDAIWTGSWTMAIAFIMLAGVYTLSHHRAPVQVKIKITNFDIQVGGRSIPYSDIKAFWILYRPPRLKILKLLTSDKFMSELSLQLDGQTPGPVREVLLKHIPEYEGRRESFVEWLIRMFKL